MPSIGIPVFRRMPFHPHLGQSPGQTLALQTLPTARQETRQLLD
jgi:hypothetical protein